MKYNLPSLLTQQEVYFITINDVKEAIATNDFEKLMNLYYLFLTRDLKIAEGVDKRRDGILALNYKIENTNPFLEKFLKEFNIKRLIKMLSDAIYYGFSIIDMAFEIKDNYLYPSLKKISPLALKYDELKEEYYFIEKNTSKRIYLKTLQNIIFYNHTGSEKIHNENLGYKIIFYAILKHTAITLNMQYFDSLAIPPLIVKTSADNEEDIKELLVELTNLKSNSFGIFPKDMEIDSLKVSNQADFLSLINYFDNLISHYITGQGIASDGSKQGSYALSKTTNERLREKIKADAEFIQEEVTKFLNKIIKLNSNFKEVKFEFIFENEVNKKELTQIIKTLNDSGYEVDEEYISKTLKIPIKKKNKTYRNNSQLILNSQFNKPLTYQEEQLINTDLNDIKEEFNIVYKILNNCSSYEEALQKIEAFDNPKLQQALESIIFANSILGFEE
jgi:phage gp29-like protein